MVAWFYQSFGAVGLIGILIPVVVVRAVYGMYHRLQAQSREMLELMVKAIEARDPYTSGHSVRVATLSRAIAQEMRLPYDMVEKIHTAALLHDVGKIHEEFAPLLRKAEPLTSDEERLMQTHPLRSAELVGVISALRGIVLDSVRSHHERWDGQGYPDQRAGDRIPLGARIITIADTVDAMTTDRPYRRAATGEMALDEVRRCSGRLRGHLGLTTHNERVKFSDAGDEFVLFESSAGLNFEVGAFREKSNAFRRYAVSCQNMIRGHLPTFGEPIPNFNLRAVNTPHKLITL